MSGVLLLVGIFVVSVLLNALFAGYETGYLRVNEIRVQQLAEDGQHVKARLLGAYLQRRNYMLTMLLLGTNISMLMGTIAITRQVGDLWAMVVATPMFLLFGEIVPKSIFRQHPTRLSLAFISPIRVAALLLHPLTQAATLIMRHVIQLPEEEQDKSIRTLMRTQEDMRVLVDESADQGTIEEVEKAMIHSVMDLPNKQAKEVMVPRIKIQGLSSTATRQELLSVFKESGRTRIPIYEGSMDKIVGVVNAFDVLRDTSPEVEDIARFIHPVLHVYDTASLDSALEAMRGAKQSMAIVTDEYGGTDGLITLEDILEEIFGEIQDEYDKEIPMIRRLGPNAYLIEARTPLSELEESVGLGIVDEEVETVGGWVMHVASKVPVKGEIFQEGDFRITILEGGRHYISSIRLEVLPGHDAYEG